MNKLHYIIFATVLLFILGCKEKETNTEDTRDSILTGSVSVLVDETISPIIEDIVAVFENEYDAKINIIAKSEAEAVNDLISEREKIIILSRKLDKKESAFFENKKLTPKTTAFAKDGIALIVNESVQDSLIDFEEIIKFVKGEKSNKFNGLVFDNPNSSTVRYVCEKAEIEKLPQEGIFSFATNNEVIQYIANNRSMIGVIGINSLYQPTPEISEVIEKVKTLKVKYGDNDYYYPTQETIAEGVYPLARVLYIINCQAYSGLGMGLASYIAGEKGQRIILKSGLSPVKIPERNIIVR